MEAAGGRKSGVGQPGPAEAPLGQCGPEGGLAADTWEAEDGLSGSSGSFYYCREARGACVADTVYEIPSIAINLLDSLYSNPRI